MPGCRDHVCFKPKLNGPIVISAKEEIQVEIELLVQGPGSFRFPIFVYFEGEPGVKLMEREFCGFGFQGAEDHARLPNDR